MSTLKFNVKDESAHEFFKDNMVSFEQEAGKNHSNHTETSVYHLMKDELFIKKDKT